MTTDKPKWWQSWIAYTLIGLLLTLGPYVGGYFLLGEHSIAPEDLGWHLRHYESKILRKVFGPMGQAEAQIRGAKVILSGPCDIDFYEPDL